jgi:hypothetical protein
MLKKSRKLKWDELDIVRILKKKRKRWLDLSVQWLIGSLLEF